MIDIKSVLGNDAHFQVNKKVAKLVGIDAAYLLSYLIDKDNFFSDNYITKGDDNYFFLQSDKIENDTTLSYKVQKKCISLLEKNEFIKTKLMGIPRKLYFTICKLHILQKVVYINAEKSTIELPKGELIYKELNNKESNNKKLNNNVLPKKNNFKNWTLEDFQNSIKTENETSLEKKDLMNFYNFWIEPSPNNKFKFQLEKTWSTNLRLKNWENRKYNTFKPISKEQNQKTEMQNAFMGAIQDLMNE